MRIWKAMWAKALAVCVCALLACAPLPASALQAVSPQASYQFTVDNIVYSVNVDTYVFVWDVADPDSLTPVVTIPAKVVDAATGIEYTVVGVAQDAFDGCTKLEDLRIGNLGTGSVYPQAFDGCVNLKTIHFLGSGSFVNPMHYTNDFDSSSITDLSIVFHEGAWSFSSVGSVRFPANTTTYYKTDFVQGSSTVTAYVRGEVSKDGTVSEGTRVGDLSNPDSVDVYSDAAAGADSICPQETIPGLSADSGAWSYVPYRSDGQSIPASVDDTISSCGTALEVDVRDLSSASVKLESATMPYTGGTVEPAVTIVDARGSEVDPGCYSVMYYTSSGEAIPPDRLIETGAYRLRATGIGDYSGYCETEFTVTAPAAVWDRASGVDRFASAQAASTQMTAFANAVGASKPSTSKRILVNSDDWAACVLADSLAGLFGCSIVTCSADELPARSISPGLTGARQGDVLVVGSTSSIGADVVEQVGNVVSGSVSRITGQSSSPAAMAVAAYDNIKKAESGAITLNLGSDWAGYGPVCLLVSESAGDAATFSALSWAYAAKAPVFFMSESGTVDAATADRIVSGGFTGVVALGVSDQVVKSLSGTFSGAEVSTWKGGADEFASSAAYADSAAKTGVVSYRVLGVGVESDWGVLSCAAAACGYAKGSLLMEDFSSDQAVDASKARIAALKNNVGFGCVFGGLEAVPARCFEDIVAIWDEEDYANLRSAQLTLDAPSFTASEEGVVVGHVLVDANGKQLVRGVDYTVLYYDNVTGEKLSSAPTVPGAYTITCKGTKRNISNTIMSPTRVSGTYYNTRSEAFTVIAAPPAEPAPAPAAVAAPAKVKKVKVDVGKKKMTVKWKKANRAKSYQVAWRVKGKSKWKTKTAKKTKLVVKKLKAGKRYQVRVRAKGDGGWGSWSKVVTTKKVKR